MLQQKNIIRIGKILTVVAFVLVSCSKKNGDYCYSCHVTGGFPYQDRMVDTCTQTETRYFGFRDANGNDLNSFCTKR